MQLTLKITGRRCDLALHPVSAKTVERIQTLGPKFYTKKYIHWWRNGNTSTCGMKFDDECAVQVLVDNAPLTFDTSAIAESAVLLRRRHYLESKARYLALLGYDDEYCHMVWTWNNLSGFDPARFDFFVHRWDRILGEKDFLILDDVRYDGMFADVQDYGGSCGFNLVDPRVIDLEEVRRELGIEPPPVKERITPPLAATQKILTAPVPRTPPPRPQTPKCEVCSSPLVIPVESPNGTGEHGCTTCKNSIQVQLRIEDEVVIRAGGLAAGCEYSKQCLVALVELVSGKSIYDCYYYSNEDVHPLMPRVYSRLDCDVYTVGALKLALRDWERRCAA